MHALCFLVAGALQMSIAGDEFTLVWQHSVQKSAWIERYRIDDGALVLVEARVQGSGAGMEPAPDSQLHDGWWVWTPLAPRLPSLVISESPYIEDYKICMGKRCTRLRELAHVTKGESAAVTLRPCDQAGR